MRVEQLADYEGESIIDLTGHYGFEDLLTQIDGYSNVLVSEDIPNGSVVVVDSNYNFYSIALLLALAKTNCIIVPIVRTTASEFDSKVKASEASIIITINSNGELSLDEIKSSKSSYTEYLNISEKGDSGIVLFSSGTTGAPKVMVHNFTKLIESIKPPKRQRKLRFLLFLMFDHIGGLNTLLNCLNSGSSMVIPESRNPAEILKLLENEKVQVLPTSPTFLNLLLQIEDFDKADLSYLKLITYGTERMPEQLLGRLNERIPSARFLQTFGTSETGILKTQSKSSNSLYFKIVDEETDYKIENDQLLIRSKTSVKNYKGLDSDKFTADGWFITGDLIEIDIDGYMKVIGRVNDVINVGGLKVLPTEIEDVLNAIEGVVDATVFAKYNAITGQVVCAKIVVKKDTDKVELKRRVKKECSQKLDRYKNPAKLIFTEKIEVTNRFKKGK